MDVRANPRAGGPARASPALLIAALLTVLVAPAAAEPQLRIKAGDWAVYEHGEGNDRVCFALSEARQPSGSGRKPAFVLVSTWPRDGIKRQVSVLAGLQLRKGSTVKVDIDEAGFELFASGDRAFVADATQELKLAEAMRKGRSMAVEVIPHTGAPLKQVFSLRGVSQSFQSIALCK